jgi:hypothetical protein
MIPQVKNWKVTFNLRDGTVRSMVVKASTKRFAKAAANEWLGFPTIHSNKITVTVVREKKVAQAALSS